MNANANGETKKEIETETETDEDEGSIVEDWEKLFLKIEKRQGTLDDEAAVNWYRDPKAIRGELRDWVYGMLHDSVKAGGQLAVDVEGLMDRFDALEENFDRLANLTRAIASTNYFALVGRLVALTLERVADPETNATAQALAALMLPVMVPQPQPPTQPPSDPTPQENS